MFGFGKKSQDTESPAPAGASEERAGFFQRLKAGLQKTRSGLTEGLASLVLGRKAIDDELLEELEARLLQADVGIETTESIIAQLTDRMQRGQLADGEALLAALAELMEAELAPVNEPLVIAPEAKPFSILMIGVNGTGKTTTIGKLTHRFLGEGRSVMLAAGDTFRAAATEQLQTWGERTGVPVIAQGHGADSASVVYDALQSAQSRATEVLIADTAGRLHTQAHLMDELKKVKRVMGKLDPAAPCEILLVLDATNGQNALTQAVQFHGALGVTGIVLTKLDGTAKGGIVFAIARRLGVPIRFIGVGEGLDDLRPFDAQAFVAALLDRTPDA